jgi:hypothetical protein
MDKETAFAIEAVARAEGHNAFVCMSFYRAGGDTTYALVFESSYDYRRLYVASTLREAQDYITRNSSKMH